MNKLIFLSTKYFTEVDFIRYGIARYLKSKINVEIWYLNTLVSKKHYNKEFKSKKVKCKKIHNFLQLENEIIKNNSKCLYDLKIAYYFKNRKILQVLSKYKINYLIHVRGDVYKYRFKLQNYLKYQFRKIINGKFNDVKTTLLSKIFMSFNSNFWGIKKANYVLSIGKYAYLERKKHRLINDQTKFIMGHHRDYDDYLRSNSKVIKMEEKKALFIDSGIPYHPDSKYNIGSITDVNPDEYYNSIRIFLEKLNKNFGYKIEISCHPKINLKKLKKHFPNFTVKIKNTINQIKYSKLIITHDSNAINFVVLYKKPIIFITNNSLANSLINHNEQIIMRAKLFNKKCINIDTNSIIDITNHLKVNKRVYKNYLNNFLKAKGPKKFQADIITERLKKDKIWI